MPAFLPVALVVSCLGAAPTNASPLRVELDGAADELREAIHTHKLPRVAVGAFTNGGKLTSSFGVEISASSAKRCVPARSPSTPRRTSKSAALTATRTTTRTLRSL